MKPYVIIATIALLTGLSPLPSAAQYYDAPPPQRTSFERPRAEHTMPMMRNDVRLEHRRQGAKCMNAYPEDHGGFSDCIRNERASSPFQGGMRRQFMPMPPGPAE